ncbi:putative dehydrogenase [Saccharothrix ecbatanensis]|uniref:Putative dehydrogenase n=1 Tax=Saccharothrix ecbatanensis TaxID=1105145 RepID=A0A7W9HJI7_9PSEU|nr:Gfo/Idh/MocA family oxidoreductase [Saccharothrix ecbatanensis]MBB5803166.1 putative dehydrogenase [Saccharothrix ecbatanensis]
MRSRTDRPDPLRLGIVALGAMGVEMLTAAASHPEYTVVRASDIDPAAIDRVRTAHPAVTFTTDAQEIIQSPDVDAVYIATPPMFHADLAIAAMGAGKAVFCEKPLAISLADGRRMVRAASERGAVGAVNFALSDRDAVLEVERGLTAGEVGEVCGIDIRLSFPRWPREFQAGAAWLAGRDQGGFVREVLSHFVYLTDRLLGPLDPVDVGIDTPFADPRASEVAARGFLRAGKVPVHVSAFSGVAGPELYEWILWGTRRSYLLRNWGELLVSDGGGWQPVTLVGPRGSEATRLSLFADVVRGENPRCLADFETALRVQTVVEAFHHADVGTADLVGPVTRISAAAS